MFGLLRHVATLITGHGLAAIVDSGPFRRVVMTVGVAEIAFALVVVQAGG